MILRCLEEAADAHALGDDEGLEAGVVLLAVAGEEAVGVFRPVAHFPEGIFHAQGDDFLAIGAAAGEAGEKLFLIARHDEEIDGSEADLRICAGTHLGCALNIEIHHDVGTISQRADDFGFERAVKISVDFGAFEEFSGVAFGEEFLVGEEMVIASIDLAGAGGAGGAGDGVAGLALIRQTPAKRGFPRTRWPGDHQQNPVSLRHGSEVGW